MLYITQISMIIGASPSDGLVSYPGYSVVVVVGMGSYLSAEMLSAYSTIPADWPDRTMVSKPNSHLASSAMHSILIGSSTVLNRKADNQLLKNRLYMCISELFFTANQ